MTIRFEATRSFNVPKDRVHAGLLDLEEAQRWMRGLVRIERMDEGPMRVGSRWKETRKMMGQEASEVFEVLGIEPDTIRLYVDGSLGATGNGEHFYTYTLEERGGSTEVTLRGEVRGLTGVAKLLGTLMARTFRNICAKDLDGLKRHLEVA